MLPRSKFRGTNRPIPTAGSHCSDPQHSQPAAESASSTADEALGCLHLPLAVSLSTCAMFRPPIKEIENGYFILNIKNVNKEIKSVNKIFYLLIHKNSNSTELYYQRHEN